MAYYSISSIIIFIFIILVGQCVSFPQLASKLLGDQKQSSSHPFQPPGPNDIRGPCPGLNTAANHGYLNRSGITTFDELVQMQRKLYNVGKDLAILLATLGVALDGDIRTGKLSIGKKSSAVDGLLNPPGGLNTHNTFEADTSLTRNDYYLANGNNYLFNGTLYSMMHAVAQQNGGLYDQTAMAAYRYQRYQQSLMENGHFIFLPEALLLYGAASFLYELFPNGTDMKPTETVISSFFGAQPDGNGNWSSVPEQIPSNWVRRQTPYTLNGVGRQILDLYLAHPVLFGGNTGKPNTFIPGSVQLSPDQETVNGILCFLYQAILSLIPSEIQSGVTTPLDVLNYVTANLDPIFGVQFGCPSTTMNLTQIFR